MAAATTILSSPTRHHRHHHHQQRQRQHHGHRRFATRTKVPLPLPRARLVALSSRFPAITARSSSRSSSTIISSSNPLAAATPSSAAATAAAQPPQPPSSSPSPPPLLRAVAALAKRHGLSVATAHVLLSNAASVSILLAGVLSGTRLGPAVAGPATAALLIANQASRPARLAAAVVLAPLAGAAIEAIAPLVQQRRRLAPGGKGRRQHARLIAAAALLCAQAVAMLAALGLAALYAAATTAGNAI